MKISVVTPVYNRAETIYRTIESVHNQTYENVQHIIVDGSSSDGTVDIVNRSLRSCDIFITEPDYGVYDAINKGIIHADGQIIAILNSDDFYSDNFVLQEVVDFFTEFNLDILYGDIFFFKKSNQEKIIRRYRSGQFSKTRLEWGWMPAHPATFVKYSVYRKLGTYKLGYKIAADFDMFCRISNLSNLSIKYVPKPFVHMQIGGLSSSGFKSIFILNFEVLRACRENMISTNFFKILSKYPSKLLEYFRI